MGDQLNLTVVEDKPVVSKSDELLTLAIDRNLDVEKLEALIRLRNAEEEREAKRRFESAFSAMQSKFTPVGRSKATDKYHYAPLDAIKKMADPIIAAHGFAYRWSEEDLPDGRLKISLTISGYDWSTTNSKTLPAYDPDKTSSGKAIMNVLQAEGARQSYGMRYTFIAGFGITVEDEDDDGVNFEVDEVLEHAEKIKLIRAATDLKALAELWKAMWPKIQNDPVAKELLTREKNLQKEALSEAAHG